MVVGLSATVLMGLAPGADALPTEVGLLASAAGEAATTGGSGAAVSEVQALEQAEETGEPVEVVSLRGESSEVFATPDGNFEAREYLRPIRTRAGGEWKPIDTGLAPAGGGMVAPGATTVGLEFSGGGGAPLVKMTKAGRELALSWPGELSAPQLDGETATYREVLPGVDLRLEAQPDGFTQLLVVKSAEAAANPQLEQLRLNLAARGMSVEETSEGGIQAVDAGAGGVVFEAPQPVMWDSSTGGADSAVARAGGNEQEPGATESGKLADVAVDIPATGDELVLTPDAQVLTGADTVYPVFIDPQWSSPRASAWTFVSKYWASSPQWKFNGKNNSGMGYCGWDYCAPHDTKRVFYRIPTSRFAGKSILSAEFVVRNVWSASCSARSVELWRTRGISSSTTWNSQDAGSGFWLDKLDTRSFAHGYDGCAAKDAEFGIRAGVQEAADKKWSTMTFGLRAGSESDNYAWKRFSDKAYLRVKYNRPPPQIKMAQLTMEYGGVCKRPGEKARVRSLGRIYARDVTDPDGDNVAVQFQAKWKRSDGTIEKWKPGRSTFKRSGSTFAPSLPSTIPTNTTVNWYARAYDGGQWSPWSYAGDTKTGCYFVYDTKVPRAPTVTSGEYPESDPEDPDDPWFDGVGRYGTFTLDSPSTDVDRYRYGINGDPIKANQLATSGGAAREASVLPSRPGVNFLTAQSFDAAGNGSEIRTYMFRVKAGQPERATWQLDEPAGAAQAAGSTPPRALDLRGGAATGTAGVRGNAVALDGVDGHITTGIPVVETTGAHAVSAWVKLDEIPQGNAMVASHPGNSRSSFALFYHAGLQRWVFNHHAADAPGGVTRAMADAPGGLTVGEWTHLVGSYDGHNQRIELFVNGQLAGQADITSLWDARRGLMLGASTSDGSPAHFLPGALDEVQLFDRRLNPDDVAKLYQHQMVGDDPSRPAVAVFDLDEPAGATQVSGHAEVIPATYHGGVTTGTAGVAGKAAGFNGTDGYAQIGHNRGTPFDSRRSYALAAWAKITPGSYQGRKAVVSLLDNERPVVSLFYAADKDRWAVGGFDADTADAQLIYAGQPEGAAHQGTWAHIVGVHDVVTQTITLYVNGDRIATADWTNARFADRPLLIAASELSGTTGEYFPGTIDDIRIYDRPISTPEVQQLYKQRPLVKARWKFEETTGTDPVTSPDASGEADTITLDNGARLGTGWIDFSGLELDGIDDHAATSVPVDTSGSFTVTGWAQAAAAPDGPVSLASAAGATTSAFNIRYVPEGNDGAGRWQIHMPGSDTTGATVATVDNGQFFDVRDWNHLALTYDGFSKELTLYVNGLAAHTVCADADGDGEPDQAGCEDLLPWAEDALSFTAGGQLHIGRAKVTGGAFGEYFSGAIDDVWALQGALSENQVAWLAGEWFDVPTQVPPDR